MEKNIIERALELARSGQYSGVSQIKPVLNREGYTHVNEHFLGLSVRRVIQAACHEARNCSPRELPTISH